MPSSQTKRVAIIGGGCSGVTCFWALQHSIHEVHLFEASSTLGGRIKTLPFEYGGAQFKVNSESPCFNAGASPNFTSLLRCLKVSTSSAPLVFGACDGVETFKWTCSVLTNVLYRQWSQFNLETCRIMLDIVRFKYLALDVLMDRPSFDARSNSPQSLNAIEYLSYKEFSIGFRDKYLIPLLSTLWSTNAGRFLPRLSIKTLARFLHDHKLLRILKPEPKWKYINISASQFIRRMADYFPPGSVHLETRVQEVQHAGKGKQTLIMANGETVEFDHVIFAIDGEEILRLSQSAMNAEAKETLQDMWIIKNIAVLHSDPLLMANPYARTSPPFTSIISRRIPNQHPPPSAPKTSLTYNINTLQNFSPNLFDPICITINPFTPPHPHLVQAVWEFSDVEISTTTLDWHRRRLPSIQNKNGMSYCALWTGRGFFEDAVTAGLRVAVEHLGAEVPFQVDVHYSDFNDDRSHRSPVLGIRDHFVLTGLALVRVYIRAFELLLALLGVFWVWVVKKSVFRRSS